MCKFIAMEDLVANALIELYEKSDGCKRVSFEQLMKYGVNIVKFFRDNEEEAVLLVSKDYVNEMLVNYSNFFDIEKTDADEEFIVLKEGKTAEDLRNHFRAYLTLDELLAFISKEALIELGVAA